MEEGAALASQGKNGHGENGLAAAADGGKSSRTGSESSQSGHQGETADEESNENQFKKSNWANFLTICFILDIKVLTNTSI